MFCFFVNNLMNTEEKNLKGVVQRWLMFKEIAMLNAPSLVHNKRYFSIRFLKCPYKSFVLRCYVLGTWTLLPFVSTRFCAWGFNSYQTNLMSGCSKCEFGRVVC